MFLIGAICWILASLFKITHAPGANTLFKFATGIMILSIMIFAIKVVLAKGKNSFLNK